jgi:hypothetical protein
MGPGLVAQPDDALFEAPALTRSDQQNFIYRRPAAVTGLDEIFKTLSNSGRWRRPGLAAANAQPPGAPLSVPRFVSGQSRNHLSYHLKLHSRRRR